MLVKDSLDVDFNLERLQNLSLLDLLAVDPVLQHCSSQVELDKEHNHSVREGGR